MKCRLLLISALLALSPSLNGELFAREVKTLDIGQPAPDFQLPGVDGKSYSLADFAAAKLLVVVFTCNHCPTAQAYEGRIKKLYESYKQRGVALVAISPNDPMAVRLDELGYSDLGDSLEDMKIRAEDQKFGFPYLFDGETQETSAAYGVIATPHVFIFDAERKLRYAGRIDDNEVKQPTSHDTRNAVEELLAGKQVSVPQTRVFGCSTKWADKRESAKQSLEKWNQETAGLEVIAPAELKSRLSAKTEKYRLVNVWATWCVPCVDELDELVKIHRMYRQRHFEVISVSADELSNASKAEQVLQEKHLSTTNFIVSAKNRDELFDAVRPENVAAEPQKVGGQRKK